MLQFSETELSWSYWNVKSGKDVLENLMLTMYIEHQRKGLDKLFVNISTRPRVPDIQWGSELSSNG